MQGTFKGIKYFQEIYNKKDRTPWFKDYNAPRGFIVMINRLRANHYNLGESLARKGIISDPNCECGQGVESVAHVLLQCPRYEEHRRIMAAELARRGEGPEINIEQWIKDLNTKALIVIHRFLTKTKGMI